jgi:hypothetical protein
MKRLPLFLGRIIVWDDHKGPEDTAKKIAALRESGRASEHDQFIVVGWQR